MEVVEIIGMVLLCLSCTDNLAVPSALLAVWTLFESFSLSPACGQMRDFHQMRSDERFSHFMPKGARVHLYSAQATRPSQLQPCTQKFSPSQRKERKITHPWQPTRRNGWNSVCACHQHDILSRQAMIYPLTMGWFLAHTSLAMTPEHSAIKGENSSLRCARAGHSKSICLSSSKAPV